MVLEYTNSAASGEVYVYGLTLISQGNSIYYIYNAHGDVVKYINASGTVLKSYEYDAFGEEVTASASDTNPFRYAGQYFDGETGTYYLRARYYSPALGRFTQQDAWGYGDPADPLSLNLYVYCFGNPVRYYDPSGNIPVETVGDIASAAGSLVELIVNPSLSNALFLVWDVASIVVPYVPGSYVAKAVKLGSRVVGKFDDAHSWINAIRTIDNVSDLAPVFLKSHDKILGSYKDIKKLIDKLDVKGFEVHHLVEKRFASNLGINSKNVDDIISVALDKDKHTKITGEIRKLIGYKNDKTPRYTTTTAEPQHIWDALVFVYEEQGLADYLPEIKQYLIENASKATEINWGKY